MIDISTILVVLLTGVVGFLGLRQFGLDGLLKNLKSKEKDLELKGQQADSKAEIKAQEKRLEEIKENAAKASKDEVERFWNDDKH